MISLLSTYRFFLLLALSATLTLMTGWFLASNQADEASEIRRAENWKLPDWKKQSLTEDIQILKDKEFFGTKKQQEEIQQEEPEPVIVNQDWRGIGIILDGRESKILIKNNTTKEIQALKIGETLPDNRIVETIQKDFFTVKSEKGVEEIRLFPFEGPENKYEAGSQTNVPENKDPLEE